MNGSVQAVAPGASAARNTVSPVSETDEGRVKLKLGVEPNVTDPLDVSET